MMLEKHKLPTLSDFLFHNKIVIQVNNFSTPHIFSNKLLIN